MTDGNQAELPTWVDDFRPGQLETVDEIVSMYKRGVDVVILDAPTGSGKTLIAEMVRRKLEHRALYMCHSKTLQDQFLHDFPYAKVLKGRSNYPTEKAPFPAITAADCTKSKNSPECAWCVKSDSCPYSVAKRNAMASGLAVVNTAYFLTEANAQYAAGTSGWPLVIADECDTLESELMRHVEFRLSEGILRRLGIEAPKKGSHSPTIAGWMTTELLPRVQQAMRESGNKLNRLFGEPDVDDIRQHQALQRLYVRAERMAEQVMKENVKRDNNAGPLVLKPVKVNGFGPGYVWRHSPKWLLMSATVVSPDEMAQSLGIEDAQLSWDFVQMGSSFPVESRRVVVMPAANVTRKTKDQAYPILAEAINHVLSKHPDESVLVHTVSYELTSFLFDSLIGNGRKVLRYENSWERDEKIEAFRSERGAVLLAPSLERGLDLPHDACRVVVIAKVPFPYLGDVQVSARFNDKGGKAWYRIQAVRTLVQMTGRATRSADDWSTTYILDRQFADNLYRGNSMLFPPWWREALTVEPYRPDRELRGTR